LPLLFALINVTREQKTRLASFMIIIFDQIVKYDEHELIKYFSTIWYKTEGIDN
jgi:hypothetical protein